MLEKIERIKYIKEVSIKTIGEKETEIVWNEAENKLIELNKKYNISREKEKKHTDLIFAHIAVYKALQEKYEDVAMTIMEEGEAASTKKTAKTYQKFVRIPFGKTAFFKIFALGCKSGFGPDAGFTNKIYEANSHKYKMDITACPYAKYCKMEGCYELTHIFCNNDIYAYGSLDGITFTRKETLGTNGTKCDFLFERKK